MDLLNVDLARARHRLSARPRDRSADNILLVPSSSAERGPSMLSPVQRSVSFKRPQDVHGSTSSNRSVYRMKRNDDDDVSSRAANSPSSTREHIYDNLDVFKRDTPPDENDNSLESMGNARRSPTNERLRPLSVHISTGKGSNCEFEHIFQQLKTRGSVRQARSNPPPMVVHLADEPLLCDRKEDLPPTRTCEDVPAAIVSTLKSITLASVLPSPSRRKTVGGIQLMGHSKVAVDETKPTPSWVGIAQQKQNKL